MHDIKIVQEDLYLIVLFPLCGALLAFLLGFVKKELSGWVATLASLSSFLLTIAFFRHLDEGMRFENTPFTWISVGALSVDYSFRFDQLTAVMCLVVTGIGSLIHLYSISYMEEDEGRHKFFAYLNLFMFAMLTLVLGASLPVMFVGWEGVGLCSYLLIGFWYKNIDYAKAGRKAFVVNRIGDAGFLVAMFLLYRQFGTLDFIELQSMIGGDVQFASLCVLVGLSLFVGATGKSAQIPLFVWLPDAMAGPTPVSALIHAATMVTAGVYMMARCNFIYALAPFALFVVSVIAVLTAFIAAATAITQNDIKKVLAYSTVSQLGFMFMAIGAGAYWVAIFHVITHAFFKACLFLGAGSVIHGCHHEQDMRHMGGLSKMMPLTFATYAASTLAIAGIYPFAGYFSKHAILEALGHHHNAFMNPQTTMFLMQAASFTAFLTAFYMTRSVAMTFFGEYRGHAHPHESPWKMVAPLIVLGALAVVGGLWLSHSLGEYLSPVLPFEAGHHGVGIIEGITSSWVGFAGVALGLLLYTSFSRVPGKIYAAVLPLSRLSLNKFYFDEIYKIFIVRPLEWSSVLLWKVVDQGMIDGAVNGSGAVAEVGGEVLRTTQSGQIRHYALFMFVSTTALIVFYLLLR